MIRSFLLYVTLFCASVCLAQNSFNNPNSFSYTIDSSSDYQEGLDEGKSSRIDVTYDSAKKFSSCTITINDNVIYSGRILDKQLYKDNQLFMLENFFEGKHNGYMSITKGNESDNIKVALIYYAKQIDEASRNTCICLLLTDIDITPNN